MKAVILAGGRGSRLQEVTKGLPKQLAEVAGDVHMKHLLDRLPIEVNELVIVTGSIGGDLLEKYVQSVKGDRKVTFIRQHEPTGTAHALLLAKDEVINEKSFVVMYADDLHDTTSIEKLIAYRQAAFVAEVPDPERFGIVELRDDMTIAGIEEKPLHPKTNFAVLGMYVFTPRIFDFEPKKGPKGEYFLTSMMEQMIEAGERITAVKADKWIPFNDVNDHKIAEQVLLKGSI